MTIGNGNSDKIDNAVGFLAVTSSTRPSVPYNDQAIRETDTGRAYVWDGTGWRQVPLANSSGASSVTGAFAVGGNATVAGTLAVTGAVTASNLNGPVFSAVQTVAQSVANNVWTSISFTTECHEDGGLPPDHACGESRSA